MTSNEWRREGTTVVVLAVITLLVLSLSSSKGLWGCSADGELTPESPLPSLELALDLRRSLFTMRLAFFFMVPSDLEEPSLSLSLELDDESELDESKAPARTPGCDSS